MNEKLPQRDEFVAYLFSQRLKWHKEYNRYARGPESQSAEERAEIAAPGGNRDINYWCNTKQSSIEELVEIFPRQLEDFWSRKVGRGI